MDRETELLLMALNFAAANVDDLIDAFEADDCEAGCVRLGGFYGTDVPMPSAQEFEALFDKLGK